VGVQLHVAPVLISSTASYCSANSAFSAKATYDLQHRVVLLGQFGVLGKGDVRDRVLVEMAESLAKLGRFEDAVDPVQEGEGGPREDEARQRQQLLVSQ
jgi:hypothetical protein